MNILLRKVFKDILNNKGKSIVIISIVMLSVAIYGGMFLAWLNISSSFDGVHDQLNQRDVRFIVHNVNESRLDLTGIEGIDSWDTRINIHSAIELPNSDKIYPGFVNAINDSRPQRVDKVYMKSGAFFPEQTGWEVVINDKFASSHDLIIGDTISLVSGGGRLNFTIVGTAFSSEYSYNINQLSAFPDIRGLGVVWIPLDTVQDLHNTPYLVNELLVKFKSSLREDEWDQVIHHIEDELLKQTDKVTSIKISEELNTQTESKDTGSLETLSRTFGSVILIIALFAIWDNLSKLIASQRNYIGTMRALGADKRKIVLNYTSISMVLGLLGVLLGLPLGWMFSYFMQRAYVSIFGLPSSTYQFQFQGFAEAIVLVFALVTLFGFLASASAASIHPREALSSAYISQVFHIKPSTEALLSKLSMFSTISSLIPIRSLFRHRKRTLLTIIAFSFSLVLMISAISFMASISTSINDNFDNNEKYDLQVLFQDPTNPQQISQQLQAIQGIDLFEQYITQEVQITYQQIQKSTTLFAYETNSQLRSLNLAEDKEFDGLAIGIVLSRGLGIAVNDILDIYNTSYSVTNTALELMGDGIYLPVSMAQHLLGFGDNVTGLLIRLDGSIPEEQVKNNILNSGLPVAAVVSSQEMKDGITFLMQTLMGMIGIIMLLGMLVIILFNFNTVVLEVMSREMEFINLRVLGSNNRKLFKIIFLQTFFILLMGLLLAIPLGYIVSDLVIQSLVGDVMYVQTAIPAPVFLATTGMATIGSMIGIIAAFKYVNSIDLTRAITNRANS